MNTLLIGDSHLRLQALDEAKSFIHQTLEVIRTGGYERVILLGDQTDTFAVIRSEILALWSSFFAEASQYSQVIALVGNHDIAGADGGTNSMEPFKAYKNVWIVSQPAEVGGIYYFPFVRDNQDFEAKCRSLPMGSVLFCHQSFNGAKFSNGFYDPHGANPDSVAHLNAVISGHIHLNQTFANIWYPGTPMQQSFGEAGEEKGIFEIELSYKGYNIQRKIILDLPVHALLEGSTISELKASIIGLDGSDLSKTNFKLSAQGAPAEIAEFWTDSVVKNFKARSRRVVDAMTSIKPESALVQTKGKTQKEKLHEFIENRGAWRSDPERLANRAEELLFGAEASQRAVAS
jgi:DNA repair exonuclease SbcCD nuclease subunit